MSSGAASGDNPQAGQGQPLPRKEADLFKSVVKHYEMKQYKKGIKSADGILRKFPNHGETLCMKGLTLNCVGKKDEAEAMIKKGLMNDMRSHVCWHVYGLMYRSDRKYNDAIKAYKQALRIDPENIQILRDLSLLQIQMRDLAGFAVTRHTILTLKPNQKINWLAFALAKHLTSDLRGAVSVIDIYLGTLTQGSPELERGFESSELALYRNAILSEIPNNYEEALSHLDECKSVVVDEGAWLAAKARCQLSLGRFSDAIDTYLLLFRRGATEDYRVHSGYMCALLEIDDIDRCHKALKLRGTGTLATMAPLEPEQRKKLLEKYRGILLAIYPKSYATRRIPLTLLDGEELKTELAVYIKKNLTRGVPSLGSDLAALLLADSDGEYSRVTDPVDVKKHPTCIMIIELVDEYILHLSTESKYDSADQNEEPPSTLLWAWYLRSYFHELCGEYSEGIALADKSLEHTPTAVDIYELKARLLLAAGDAPSAADCLDKGRELDKQDRYINNQTTKFMLLADREDVARDRISLFTRHEGNPEQNLYDMQCAWYELDLADCLARKKEWGKSLKKYLAVEKHFEDFHEDQFDFHSYCVRKVTLRAYTDVLRFEDELWGQPYYGRAAEGIIRIYLYLYDHPPESKDDEEPDYSKMTAAERKKAKAIARKKKKKAEKKAAEAAAAAKTDEDESAKDENGNKKKSASSNNKPGGPPAVLDDDPNGEALLKLDFLEEAKKFSSVLSTNAPNRLSTWIYQYDVAIRRGKFLLALQALFKARTLAARSDEVFSRTVDFLRKGKSSEEINASVKEVLESETERFLDGKSLTEFVQEAAEKVRNNNITDLPMRIAVAKALVNTSTGSVSDACAMIVEGGLDGRGVTPECCRQALACLEGFGEDANDAKSEWISSVKERFPMIQQFR